MSALDTVEEMISRAAQTSEPEDFDRLFAGLRGVELYFNVAAGAGAGDKTAGTGQVVTPLVETGSGLKALRLFTSRDNSVLRQPYAGILWQRALELVLSGLPEADGLIVQNNAAAWVGVDRQKAKALLNVQ